MAWELPVLDLSFEAASDLAEAKFRIIKLNAYGKVELAGPADRPIGVLQNNPLTGEAAHIRVLGVSKVVSGDEFPIGTVLTADENGRAVPCVSAKPIGVALEEATAADQIITVLVIPGWETL